MGNCIYCGIPAGIFRSSHKACSEKHGEAKNKIIALIENSVAEKHSLTNLKETVTELASVGFIKKHMLDEMLITGWENAVSRAFEDSLLSEEEEKILGDITDVFELSQEQLERHGAWSMLVKGAVLRDICNGIVSQRVQVTGDIPFNLQKDEKIIWYFNNVEYHQEKTRTRYVGGSQGFSVRIARGLYYRTGGFKGERVESAEIEFVDEGVSAITNKHVYFHGSVKSFRIAYGKVVSFNPVADGIKIQKDAQNARPQILITGDEWFTYNLLKNIAQM